MLILDLTLEIQYINITVYHQQTQHLVFITLNHIQDLQKFNMDHITINFMLRQTAQCFKFMTVLVDIIITL